MFIFTYNEKRYSPFLSFLSLLFLPAISYTFFTIYYSVSYDSTAHPRPDDQRAVILRAG
jgi:hypothetical protein